jgi:Domain of unknown function (DUF2019)
MKKNITSNERKFVDLAIAHHELSVSGNTKGSNTAHKQIGLLMHEIVKSQDKGAAFLNTIVCHGNPSVRLWAATYLLHLDSKVAVKTLENIIQNQNPWQLQTMAEVVIDQWKNGLLKLDNRDAV